MKKAALVICVCSFCLVLMAGCGSREPEDSSLAIVEVISETEAVDLPKEDETSLESKNTGSDVSISDEKTDELCGDVKSINAVEKFVVVSKIYLEKNGDSEIAVSLAEGSSDEELVMIYFVNDAKYILETGKADGSNINRTEADFSSIMERDTLELKGLENIIGTEFLATEVKIIRVID